MKTWFNNLARREQWISLFGLALVIFFIGYQFIWAPLAKDNQRLIDNNARLQADAVWIKQTVQTIKSLQGSGSSAGSSRSLSQLVDQAAASKGVRISRFQPAANNEAQIWLERIEFNKLMALLDQLENAYGVGVKTLSVSSANSPGLITARIRLKK